MSLGFKKKKGTKKPVEFYLKNIELETLIVILIFSLNTHEGRERKMKTALIVGNIANLMPESGRSHTEDNSKGQCWRES